MLIVFSTTILGRLTPWLISIAPSRTVKNRIHTISQLCSLLAQLARKLPIIPIGDREESRTKGLSLLTELFRWHLPNLHVLATNRREPDKAKALTPLAKGSLIRIQTDIQKYIKSQLTNNLGLKKWSPLTKEKIENTLGDQAHGMYKPSTNCRPYFEIECSCQIDSIKKCIYPKDVREAPKTLPETLDDFYAGVILDISHSYRPMTINALQWLTFSKQPLCIEE